MYPNAQHTKIADAMHDLADKAGKSIPEPVFLNVYGAQESIPRNEFHQSMWPGGPVR